jgi:paraquat-inducible protein A
LVLLLAVALVVLGWIAPAMSVSQFFIFEEAVSLATGLRVLVGQGEYALAALIVIFAMALPILRIGLIYALWRFQPIDDRRLVRKVRFVESLGKWSMLDVFVMALVFAAMNISLIADVHMHWGVYSLASGVLLSMLAATRVSQLARRVGQQGD